MISRRQAIIALGVGLLVSPFGVLAQQAARVWRVGFLATTSPVVAPQAEALRAGLRDLGYVEGKNIIFEYRWVEGALDRLPERATELVQAKVDIIFAWGTPATAAAKRATSTIPIVFAGVADPVGSGLISSLARPDGNLTGITNLAGGLSAKLVELLVQINPGIKAVAVLRNSGNPASALMLKEVDSATRMLALRLQQVDIRTPDDLDSAFASMGKERAAGVVILADPMIFGQRRRIAELATKYRIPSIYTNREYAEVGGLMCYGPNQADGYRYVATFVDKILKGAKPADLPVEQPTKFELIINRKTAKALGLTIPQSLLISADKVIE